MRNVNDILIGTGKAFVNGRDVGQLKGDVTFKHSKEFYEVKAGFPETTLLKVLISESAEAQMSLIEINLDTVAALMPEYRLRVEGGADVTVSQEFLGSLYSYRWGTAQHSRWTDGTVSVQPAAVLASTADAGATKVFLDSVTRFKAGDSVTLRKGATTETKTIASGGVVAGERSVTFTTPLGNSYDFGALAVNGTLSLEEGTDYGLDRLEGRVIRRNGSTKISDGDAVAVSYIYRKEASKILTAGGVSTTSTFPMRFEHTRRDGRKRVVEFYKCSVTGDFSIPFAEKSEAIWQVTVSAQADSSRPEGDQLYSIRDEEV